MNAVNGRAQRVVEAVLSAHGSGTTTLGCRGLRASGSDLNAPADFYKRSLHRMRRMLHRLRVLL
jgi:hypothetical protein